ncbi:hypothetical protein EDD17DRAFT_1426224, partial [Pisolithus thermaeus]
GRWCYAGAYRAPHVDDLTTREWELLSTGTTQVLIKETLTGWENVSLRNLYKMGQPNATGALRVLCVGLPYVILDNKMYHAVPQQ